MRYKSDSEMEGTIQIVFIDAVVCIKKLCILVNIYIPICAKPLKENCIPKK